MEEMRKTIWLPVALLVLSSLACGLFGRAGEALEAGREAATAVAELGAAVGEDGLATLVPQLIEEGAAADDSSDDAPIGPEIDADALFDLRSYRLRITTEWTSDEGESHVTTLEEARTRDPWARSMVMQGMTDDMLVEFVEIGDQAWMCSAGSCTQMPADSDEMESAFGDMGVFRPETVTDDARFLGRETVNGIQTRHYALDLTQMTALLAAEGHVSDMSGEIWIADEPDLPKFTVRYQTSWRVKRADESGRQSLLHEVYDINVPFTIEPPEGADRSGLPEDVPAYPGGQQEFSMAGMTAFSTDDALADVAEFYREALVAEGWTLESDEVLEQMVQQRWTKDARMVTLVASAQDDGTSVMITVDDGP